MMAEDVVLRQVAYRSPRVQESEEQILIPIRATNRSWRMLCTGQSVMLHDVWADTPESHEYRHAMGEEYLRACGSIRSVLVVPLRLKERMLGLLTVSYGEPDHFTADHAQLLMMMANQAAIAIENARLYTQAQQETRKTEALARVAASVTIASSLETTVQVLARSVAETAGAAACSVVLMMDASLPARVRLAAAYGLPDGYIAALEAAWAAGAESVTLQGFRERRTVVMRNYPQVLLNDPRLAPLHQFAREVVWDTVVAIPLTYRGQVLGTLNVYFLPESVLGEADWAFLGIIADQAAMAVENTRLVAEVQEKAAVEERQRLARELHDAVTQALFSASIIADVLPRLWEQDPEDARQHLEDLRRLTRGALAEMRALLVELRPAGFTEADLGELLRHLTEALAGRKRLPVDLVIEGTCMPPADVRVALYRIAQEALNNIAKHAHASRATVRLVCRPDRVDLGIMDDGVGFDPTHLAAEHFGLGIMRERAAAIGAALSLESQPGHGTQVTVVWSGDQRGATP